MSRLSPSLYAALRFDHSRAAAFREGQQSPPEQLLQAIWQHQRIRRDKLKTVAGQPLFILHPGYLNREAGPDFLRAVVQLGHEAPQTGDIEVDSLPADWIHHRHHENPAYNNVLLQVVWNARPSARRAEHLPVLALEPVLDDSPANLAQLLKPDENPALPAFIEGRCAAPLRDLENGQLEVLLTQASWVRFQLRAEQCIARAREAGWTQVLWEGLFRGLGYKHNKWPMLRVAELANEWHKPGSSLVENTSRLMGLSGLLPSESSAWSPRVPVYLRELWDCWWRDRDALVDWILPGDVWRMGGIRPSNHPQRRLALAAQWVTQGTLPDQLKAWSQESCSDSKLPSGLLKVLQVKPDAFWSHHYTLRARYSAATLPMLGTDRVSDLAANVILPWLWAMARKGRRKATCLEIERRYLAWPASSDNSRLKLTRQRLFGTGRPGLPRRMAMQQGLLQITQDYCDRSNSLCDGCLFPKVARQFKASP